MSVGTRRTTCEATDGEVIRRAILVDYIHVLVLVSPHLPPQKVVQHVKES